MELELVEQNRFSNTGATVSQQQSVFWGQDVLCFSARKHTTNPIQRCKIMWCHGHYTLMIEVLIHFVQYFFSFAAQPEETGSSHSFFPFFPLASFFPAQQLCVAHPHFRIQDSGVGFIRVQHSRVSIQPSRIQGRFKIQDSAAV